MKNLLKKILIITSFLFLPLFLVFAVEKNINIVIYGNILNGKLSPQIAIEGATETGLGNPTVTYKLTKTSDNTFQVGSGSFVFGTPPLFYPNNYSGSMYSVQNLPQVDVSPGEYTISLNISGFFGGQIIINNKKITIGKGDITIQKIESPATVNNLPKSGDSVVDVDPKNGQVPTGAGDTYKLLAPIKGVLEENPANPNEYINKMYKIALGFASALAVLMIMFAGFQYMTTEAITGKTNAKKKITGAILGLVLALTSFLIVKTINPNFVKLDLFISGAKLQIDEDVHGDTRHKERNGKYCSSGGSKTVGLYTPGESWGNDATTRADLQKNGIKINNQNCTNVGANNCTSVYKLPTASVINFKNKCKKIDDRCDITITGGTECWLHSWNTQHRPESSTVDLRTTGIENYVKAKGKEVGKSSLGPIFEVEGVRLLKESSHYHVISW